MLFVFLPEHLVEKSLCSLKGLVTQDDRFGFALGIRNQSILVQSVHRVPVKGFPRRPRELFLRFSGDEVHQCECRVIHFVFVVFHYDLFSKRHTSLSARPRRASRSCAGDCWTIFLMRINFRANPGLLISCSQIRITAQPALRSHLVTRASRRTFPEILHSQYF